MDWFFLSMLCAFSLASADAFTKKRLSGYSGTEMMLVRLVVPALLLSPLLLIYPLSAPPPAFWGWIAILVPLELTAMYLYMTAIRDAPLYQTLPYLAFTPVFNILTGWLMLGEHISTLGGLGIILVVGGAYLLNIDKAFGQQRQSWLEPMRAIVHQQGSRRMLMVAVIYSVTSVGGKAAMLYVGPLSFAPFYFAVIGAATLILVALVHPAELRVFARQPGWHLFIGLLFVLMAVTHFLAMQTIEAAYMVAVKRTSLLFGILYGVWLFNEPGLMRHFSVAVLMVAGVALILLA